MSQMANNSRRRNPRRMVRAIVAIISIAVIVMYVYLFHVIPHRKRQAYLYETVCPTNLQVLGKAMIVYADDHDSKYPEEDKWCDLLLHGDYASPKQFVCKTAASTGDNGPSHYAMNPDCEPNSPPDVVLLFETEGGWNQHDGPEILTTEKHRGEGCNIAFADTHVEFVKTQGLSKLKWEAEESE